MAKMSKKEFEHFLVGRKVIQVRDMTGKEIKAQGWYGSNSPQTIVFDDGSIVFASCDPEGNDAGCLFAINGKGESVYV